MWWPFKLVLSDNWELFFLHLLHGEATRSRALQKSPVGLQVWPLYLSKKTVQLIVQVVTVWHWSSWILAKCNFRNSFFHFEFKIKQCLYRQFSSGFFSPLWQNNTPYHGCNWCIVPYKWLTTTSSHPETVLSVCIKMPYVKNISLAVSRRHYFRNET